MKYKIVKQGTYYQFIDINNDRIVFNLNQESINQTIDECNYTINEMNDRLYEINTMEDNNITEYHPFVHGIWHDTGCTIKIMLTHEQYTPLSINHPELLEYVLSPVNDIFFIVENGFIYLYVNYFEEGHKDLLKMYGALIFDKNEPEPNE